MTDGQKKLLVGIDPGKTCGWASYRPNVTTSVFTLDLGEAIDMLHLLRSEICCVYLEWPQYTKRIHRVKADDSSAVAARKGADVGINFGIAYTLRQLCISLGIPVVTVPPEGRSKGDTRKQAKDLGLKCSEHAADALWLVNGRSLAKVPHDLLLESQKTF